MRFLLCYIFTLFFAFSYMARTQELIEKNRISLFAATWPGFNLLFLLDTGLNYDRLLTPHFALSATGKYELAGHMYGYYHGGTFELGTKYMFWSHGERAFSKGFLAGLSTGIGMGASSRNGDPDIHTIIEKCFWMPFTIAAQYMYTWDNNLFLTAGVRSQLFQVQFSKGIIFYPWPRLELSIGYAF